MNNNNNNNNNDNNNYNNNNNIICIILNVSYNNKRCLIPSSRVFGVLRHPGSRCSPGTRSHPACKSLQLNKDSVDLIRVTGKLILSQNKTIK